MRDNALSVANYFIDLAKKKNEKITQLGLMKRVYIAHGFSLAIYDKSLLDERFDKVEAWKYGPVIPSVYHSFKIYKAGPITEKTVAMRWDDENDVPTFETPELSDENAKKVVEMVWERYHNYTEKELIDITHRAGTPWSVCYKKNMNVEIPDELTKLYYERLIKNILDSLNKK